MCQGKGYTTIISLKKTLEECGLCAIHLLAASVTLPNQVQEVPELQTLELQTCTDMSKTHLPKIGRREQYTEVAFVIRAIILYGATV